MKDARIVVLVAAAMISTACAAKTAAADAPRGAHARLVEQVLSGDEYARLPSSGPFQNPEEEARRKSVIMESDAMQDALLWLEDYFAVSAQFDEGQVAEFYEKLGKMSSGQLRLFLRDVDRVRGQLQSQWQAAQRMRAEALQAVKRRTTVPSSTGYRGSSHAATGYFQTQRGYAASKRPSVERRGSVRYYPARPPLISSLDVARIVVWREFWWPDWRND